jgi:hypothetical protein
MKKIQKFPILKESSSGKKYEYRDKFVIITEDREEKSYLFCPVCQITMNTADDYSYIRRFKCCSECGMKWAEPMREKWLSGWRPSDEEVLSHKEIIKQASSFFIFE